MSRIVFANHLRKTITGLDRPVPIYARKRSWALLGVVNAALFCAVAMSWKIDSLWAILPAAKAYSIPSMSMATRLAESAPTADSASAAPTSSSDPQSTADAAKDSKAETPAAKSTAHAQAIFIQEPLTPKGQKAAQYIAKTYHIAKEASELIVKEAFKAGRENNVDPLLVLAVIAVESRFNPISESQAGALGLTQAMPEWHPEKVAVLQKDRGHILNIADNIKLGTKIISENMKRFDNNAVLALQQYNGSLQDANRSYSKHVLELRAKLIHAVG